MCAYMEPEEHDDAIASVKNAYPISCDEYWDQKFDACLNYQIWNNN